MIIAMDVGNTNIKTGIYDGRQMVQYVRFSTDMKKTSDEYGLMLLQFLQLKGISLQQIEAAVVSSVVPSINFTIEHMCRTYFDFDPLLLGPGVRTGLNIRYDNPREVGSDRIASAVAAFELHGGPAIVNRVEDDSDGSVRVYIDGNEEILNDDLTDPDQSYRRS